MIKKVKLLDGREVTIRYLKKEDCDKLYDYFCKGISEDDILLFKDNVRDYYVVNSWCENMNPDRVISIVAEEGSSIVSTGTLHLRGHGWFRYFGKIRVSVCISCRGIGLGEAMIETLLELAKSKGLRVIMAEVLSVQELALKVFKECGFIEAGKIENIAKDVNMKPMDLHILLCYLEELQDSKTA